MAMMCSLASKCFGNSDDQDVTFPKTNFSFHLFQVRRSVTWEQERIQFLSVRRQDINKASRRLNGFAGKMNFISVLICSLSFKIIILAFTEAVSPWAPCRIAGLLCTHLSLEPLSLFILPGKIHPSIHPSIYFYAEFGWSRLPTAFTLGDLKQEIREHGIFPKSQIYASMP